MRASDTIDGLNHIMDSIYTDFMVRCTPLTTATIAVEMELECASAST